jgi:hypothetical protein
MFDPASPYGTVTNITDQLQPDKGKLYLMTTFAEDQQGNLYVATFAGDVFRLVTDAAMPGDFYADGIVDAIDLAIWSEQFGGVGEPGQYSADASGDGSVGGSDFLIWQQNVGYNSLSSTGDATGSPVPEPHAAVLLVMALTGRRRLASAVRIGRRR